MKFQEAAIEITARSVRYFVSKAHREIMNQKHKKILIVLFFSVLLAIGCFVFFQKPQQAEAGWFDDSWLYRKSVAVTNNTTAESNVYIAVTIIDTDDLITAGKMQADCGDLRWTEYNGIVLPYYIVSGCNTASTVVHIELESFPAGAQTLYYYYGNPSATDGFEASDFTTSEASNYTPGTIGDEEKGPGPVAYWSFDEGYGDTTYDATDNANDGTRGGGTPAYKPIWQDESMCVSGKCLHFDGDDDYVDCGDLSAAEDQSFTYSAWIKTTDTDRSIVTEGSTASDTPIVILMGQDGVARGYYRHDTSGNRDISGSSTINDGNWHYLALTSDEPGGTLRLYVDGNEENSGLMPTGVITLNTTTIGALMRPSAGSYFNGSIDEVRIYPYARSAAEIRKDYNAGLAGLGGGTEGVGAALGGGGSQKWMTDGLVGFWKMDESLWDGSADEVVDASGAGNHGVSACTGGGCSKPTTGTGKFGPGGVFDGTDDYVDCGNNASLDFSGSKEITICAWIKVNSLISDDAIVSRWKYQGDLQYYLKFESDDNSIKFAIQDTATQVARTGANSIFQDVWHFICGKREGNIIYAYVDGAQGATTDTVGTVQNSSDNISIGRRISNDSVEYEAFNGSIDQVRIYNRALSPKEIRDLYNFAPGPVLHLKMDERVSGNAQTLYDISTNENNGTTNWGANATGMDCSKPGKFGTACDFDGTDDYVSVSDFAY